jgi:hypothetical protein
MVGDGTAMSRFFEYDLDPRFAPVWLALGVRPRRDGVTLTDDGRFLARYGWFRVDTPLGNVESAHTTGNYRWWTAVGVRLSAKDDGLTFGTNARRGVCVHFRDRIPRVVGLRDHSALTVTVRDADGLIDALRQRG